jgi:hypothetical protein
VTDTAGDQHFFAIGSALLNHDMGRTWNASLGYDRHVDFSGFYLEPLLLDTVTANFGGLIASRLSFHSFAGYSQGTVGFGTGDNSYRQSDASALLQYAFFRYVALSAGYFYYHRWLGDAVIASPDISNYSESQSFRVFVSGYLPLFHRARRANATR